MKISHFPSFFIIFAVLIETPGTFSALSHASPDISLLKKSIISYNLEHHQKSLSNGSYRGGEGILRILPEVGRSFGLKVLMDRDYLDAKQLFEEADRLFEKAVEAMTAQEHKTGPAKNIQIIAESALRSRWARESAQKKLVVYRSKLLPELDERLNEGISSSLLEKLLEESLSKASCNLRDALGYLYNRCQGLDEVAPPLTPENVQFVNYVFNEFTEKAPEKARNLFGFDRYGGDDGVGLDPGRKLALGRDASRYVELLVSALKIYQDAPHPVDLLLFLALIKQESNFAPRNVSPVGAVGLTQIMPSTAKDLGMKNIFVPPYFIKAKDLMGNERKLRARAMALVLNITEENKLQLAGRAMALMQRSLAFRREGAELYSRYKRALLKNGTDDRLDPRKSIEYGLRYFSRMMRMQRGDISLALASYNAGPHRVRKYRGIPPFPETVSFRNRILLSYREYLRRLNRHHTGCQWSR